MKSVFVSDFTLRQFAQEESNLLFREKTAVAACLDGVGVDRIELPPVTRAKEDRIIGKTIAALVQDAALAIPVGTDEASVADAWACVCEAKRPCLQVMLPVATAQMEYGFRAKEPAMLDRITRLVSAAKAACPSVEFTALDATRADRAFLLRACGAAVESGADCLVLSDDVGASLPEEIAAMVRDVKQALAVPVLVCLSDRIHMAAACAMAALAAGADGVKTAMTGTDVLRTEHLAVMLSARGASADAETKLKVTELHRDITETLSHLRYEAAPAAPEGQGAADIFLDGESTLSDVCQAVKTLGYDLSDDDCGRIFHSLLDLCAQKGHLGTREFEALIASNAMQVPSTYHLGSYSATCTNSGMSMAQVTLWRADETLYGVATGGGPIDAAFRAIEQSVGSHYELDDFEIQAVTEGKEALGSALVRLRSGGRLFAGNGLSSDIVGASIQAYINALNKIVFEEK